MPRRRRSSRSSGPAPLRGGPPCATCTGSRRTPRWTSCAGKRRPVVSLDDERSASAQAGRYRTVDRTSGRRPARHRRPLRRCRSSSGRRSCSRPVPSRLPAEIARCSDPAGTVRSRISRPERCSPLLGDPEGNPETSPTVQGRTHDRRPHRARPRLRLPRRRGERRGAARVEADPELLTQVGSCGGCPAGGREVPPSTTPRPRAQRRRPCSPARAAVPRPAGAPGGERRPQLPPRAPRPRSSSSPRGRPPHDRTRGRQ